MTTTATTHEIRPSRESLHGRFDATLEPCLTVESGDVVVFRDTLDVTWGCGQHVRGEPTRPRFGPRVAPRDDGPALHGPVAVRGARPGDTLAIEILQVEPGPWGWTAAGDGPFNAALNRAVGIEAGERALVLWTIDAQAGTAQSELGPSVALRPFPGILGLCPPGEPGVAHSGWWPTRWGGNMDCRELVAGTTLYLPVGVEGGLLSTGDGHACQGDGELAGTAIECPLARLELRLRIAHERSVSVPTLRTPGAWITLGFGRELDEAIGMATRAMLELMQPQFPELGRAQLMALASVAVELRVTQLVNGVRGVHAVLPDGALRR